jgi:hypothetical protein
MAGAAGEVCGRWVCIWACAACRARARACCGGGGQGSFDLSLLSDYRERPLVDTMLVERVLPLVTCPARLYVTTEALYLQPVPLNDIGAWCAPCVGFVPGRRFPAYSQRRGWRCRGFVTGRYCVGAVKAFGDASW